MADDSKKPSIFVIGARAVPDFQGGIEKQVETLYPLLKNDFEIHIAVMKKYVKNKKWKHANLISFPSFPIKKAEKVFYSFFSSMYALFKGYDIIHVQGIGSALFIPIIKLRKKTKVVLHYRSQDYTYPKWGRLGRAILKIAEKIGVNYADVIVVVAKRYKEHLIKTYGSSRIIYVPNVLVISHQQDLSVLNSYGLEPSKFILSVGRITREKRFEMLISAYLRSQLPNKGIKLVIVGGSDDGAYFRELKDLAKNDNVVFTGSLPRKQLNALYANALSFILPSSHEGTPNVVLEAMSFSIPVYVSKIKAHEEFDFPEEMYFSDENELIRILDNDFKVLYNPHVLNAYHPYEVATKISEIFKKLLEED